MNQSQIAVLAAQLEEVSIPASLPVHGRAASRLAVTFAVTASRGEVPEAALELHEFRLVALTHRVCAGGRRGPKLLRRKVMAAYQPSRDEVTGRTVYRPVRVLDLNDPHAPRIRPANDAGPARDAVQLCQAIRDVPRNELAGGIVFPTVFYAFEAGRMPTFEAHIDRATWAGAEVSIGEMRAWPSHLFVRRPGQRFETHPVDGSPDPWATGEAGDAVEHGGWALVDGVPTPKAQAPDRVYAYLGHLAGRQVRNPAYEVLRARGVVPAGMGLVDWRNGVARRRDDGTWEPRPERYEALMDAVAVIEAADPGTRRPRVPGEAFRSELVAAVIAHAEAAGLPLGDDPDATALGFLMAPWVPAVRPAAAAIQAVALAGMPSTETLSFLDDESGTEADLYDLGAEYASVPVGRAEEASKQWGTRPRIAGRTAARGG